MASKKKKNQQGIYPSSLNKYPFSLSDLDGHIHRRVVLHSLNNLIIKQQALLREEIKFDGPMQYGNSYSTTSSSFPYKVLQIAR